MYSLRQKINQLFIAGYEGENPSSCSFFTDLLKNGLGGVIFFTKNIISKDQFIKSINQIKKTSFIMPFLSIDQEGGEAF